MSALNHFIRPRHAKVEHLHNDVEGRRPSQRKDSNDPLVLWWIATTVVVIVLTVSGYIFSTKTVIKEFSTESIVVSITAFADQSCLGAVSSALTMAENAERLHFIVTNVGVPKDGVPQTHSCLANLSHSVEHWDAIREAKKGGRITELFTEFIGVEHARGLAAEHIKMSFREKSVPLDFILEIMGASLFAHNWDIEMIREWTKIGDNNAILSTYPSRTSQIPQRTFSHNDGFTMNVICGLQRFRSVLVYSNPWEIVPPEEDNHQPLEIPFYSHLMSFGRLSYLDEVPHDPYLKHLQHNQGVELIYSARLGTSKIRVFAPSQDLVYFDYGSEHSTKRRAFVDSFASKVFLEQDRVNTMLKLGKSKIRDATLKRELSRYGVSDKISLDDWKKLTHVDEAYRRGRYSELCNIVRTFKFKLF